MLHGYVLERDYSVLWFVPVAGGATNGGSRQWTKGSLANAGCLELVAVSCAGTGPCVDLHCDVPIMRSGVHVTMLCRELQTH